LETNNHNECYFFAKYVQERKSKDDSSHHWVFNFTRTEIDKLQELYHDKEQVKLVLICTKEGLADSELAIISYEETMDCLGIEAGVNPYRINIKSYSGKHGLRMYGSGRSDKLNGKDNTLKITRQELFNL